MNIRNVYDAAWKIPEESRRYFKRKGSLNDIEHLGLEALLQAFVQQYEEQVFGEVYTKNLTDYTRYLGHGVDILDGVYDTYIFENYAVDYIWMTENGIPVLSCYRLESDDYEDPLEIVQSTDWTSECEPVWFRLD